MEIITNNQPRELIAFCDLPEKARTDFDYVSEDDQYSARFFSYRGSWHDSNEFVRIAPRSKAVGFEHSADENSPLLGWDGIQTDSYFSATLVRYADSDCESVIVGRCYS